MDIANFGARDALMVFAILAAILAAALVGYALFRLSRNRADATEPVMAPSAATSATAVESAAPSTTPGTSPEIADKTSFALRQFIAGVQGEMEELRQEVAQLRAEVAQLKATHGTSPQYNDAVQLARADADPTAIADECGISVAEAELVRALVRHGINESQEH